MQDAPRDHLDGIVEQWRAEFPDLPTDALALTGRLLRAAQLLDRKLSAPLRDRGLEPGWFDLLAALRRAGRPYELNPTAVMRATLLSSAGVTKRLDRLERAGLIRRRPDPSDRRGTLVGLTARGRAAIDRALPDHIAREEQLLAALRPDQRAQLDGLLHRLLLELEL